MQAQGGRAGSRGSALLGVYVQEGAASQFDHLKSQGTIMLDISLPLLFYPSLTPAHSILSVASYPTPKTACKLALRL